MSNAFVHTNVIATGRLRSLRREPAYLLFTLAQPLVWLVLFGQLFKRLTDMPGFETSDYISYLTPGVVVMTAVMSANWSGTGLIDDMNRGVMNRYLTSSIRRSSIVSGVVAYQAVITFTQSLIVLGVGWLLGAQYPGGPVGIAIVVLLAVLISSFFSAVSCAMALVLRSDEALIGMSQMLALPLIFLSSVLMAPELLPDWISTVATVNPIDWAAQASREALSASPDWTVIGLRGLLLMLVWIGASVLATLAFRSYRRNI